jgi:tRNA (guanine26-N2/guanine27-N2)-dimethyltransferase
MRVTAHGDIQELSVPFYFTPSRVASFFHCNCPSLDKVASVGRYHQIWYPVGLTFFFFFFLGFSSALLNAGHQVSRSHAAAGSLKTTATRRDLHDVYRSWVKTHPVKMDKIPPNSPARILLEKEPRYDEPREPLSTKLTAYLLTQLLQL